MLRALNAELSLVGEFVTQGGAPLRAMRFQWWKDAVNQAYKGTGVNQPVITALQHCLHVRPLSKYRLQKMIAAKAADQVEHRHFATVSALEDFAEATQSNLHYLQLEAAGIKNADVDHAASHLGKAVGLAALLRGTHRFLDRGISYLPLDECAKHGVAVEDLYRGQGRDSAGFREIVYQLASVAHGHLHQSRDLHGRPESVPREARQMFLSSVSCRLFLEALEKCDFNLADKSMVGGGYSPFWYVLQLKYAQLRL